MPSGKASYADPKKSSTNHQKLEILGRADMQSVHACAVQTHFSAFVLYPEKCIKKTSKMLPFGYLWGPLGVKMPLLGLSGGSLKNRVFWEGSRCSLWLQNDSQNRLTKVTFCPVCWYLVRIGTPLCKKYPKR